jgi:predicted transcriptional regulator
MDQQAITVRLPKDLYERLRLAAFEDRTSQVAIITEAVTEKLDRRDAGKGGA